MSNTLDLSERMALRKRNAGLYVGTHAAIIGQTLSDIAPVMTQAVSALTVGYATFEGVQHYFGTHWLLSIFVGLIAAIAVEAVGFVAVDERDKAEAHNRRTPDKTQHVDTTKAQIYVASSFVVTIALVATFESVPAVVRWWGNEAALGEMLFRVGLLVFPFLSRLGANLFAFRSVREGVDHSAADLELRDLELSLRKDEMRAKYAAKVAKYDVRKPLPVAGNSFPSVATTETTGNHQAAQLSETIQETIAETIEKTIVRFLKANPGARLEDIAAHAQTTKGTVSKKVGPLVDAGVLDEVREGKRRILRVNGNHEQFLAA